MNRTEEIELLEQYGVGFLEQGQPTIGLMFIHFAGRVSLKDKYPEIFEDDIIVVGDKICVSSRSNVK